MRRSLQALANRFTDTMLQQQCVDGVEAKLMTEIAGICDSAKKLQKFERMIHNNGAEFHRRMEKLDEILMGCNRHHNTSVGRGKTAGQNMGGSGQN